MHSNQAPAVNTRLGVGDVEVLTVVGVVAEVAGAGVEEVVGAVDVMFDQCTPS